RGHKEVVELLIANGAGVNAKRSDGVTPLDFAIKYKRTETADLLRKHGGKRGGELKGGEPVAEAAQPEPQTAKAPDIDIHSAATEGNIEAVKQQLAEGADVNAKNDLGSTALHLAQDGDKEIAELLITKGADVSVKDKFGRTPLHLAAMDGHWEIAELLIAKSASVNAKNGFGLTPLHSAAAS
ncbi:MAG: ankyrin repeat domain-containing protein, partial [Arenicellales bacterium]|nr:ankyrin repeat domain-containing protein [Arenicellales bacterium]